MKFFSIKDLEQLSGIKAHTIRMWEFRYQTFAPIRNKGKIRRYSLQEVQRLLFIAILLKKNYRIAQISTLNSIELEQKLHALSGETERQDKAVGHLIFYMYSDAEKFEDVLDSCVNCWGIDTTLKKVVLPFLEKVNLLSYKDNNFETHFAVTAIRKKLIWGIEKEKNAAASFESALLFLPEGEHYDLMLLYANYILKQQGIRVWYLGTNVSLKNLQNVIESKPPLHLFTYLPQSKKFKLLEFASYLKNNFSDIKLQVIHCDDAPLLADDCNIKFVHYRSLVNNEITDHSGSPILTPMLSPHL